ncbi:cytochrome P450 [Ascodesmis nigricans]|uniref:Cytochrome P450 n=1 Tax=Ascodesmis nigricans TaxID=341454 RepID=A0A4S2MHW9_9PEZI|nr:cytochrome P450 [Ascodesmis nigricans]
MDSLIYHPTLQHLLSLSWVELLIHLAILFTTYTLLEILYNLYLHPLRHVPGPRWAAASPAWAIYWTIYRPGQLSYELERAHLKYGPVLRIEPNRLSFSSASAYTTIYTHRTSPQTFTKDPHLYSRLGDTDALGFYLDHRLARTRREFLNPDFTRRRILLSQGVVAGHVEHLVARLLEESQNRYKDQDGERVGDGDGEEVDIYRAFRSLTLDTISRLVLGRELGALDAPGFSHELVTGMELVTLSIWWRFRSRVVCVLMNMLAQVVVKWAQINLFGQVWFNRRCEEAYERTVEKVRAGVVEGGVIPRMVQENWGKRSVVAECADLIFAGSDTVGNALTTGFTHLLRNPDALFTLLAELKTIWPDPSSPLPAVEALEKLPYLQAVIKEFLRLSHGVTTPLFRVTAVETVVDGWRLPKGTYLGCANPVLHLDPSVYKDPHRFDPERWLNADSEELARMGANLVAFSRGPRSCLGMQ